MNLNKINQLLYNFILIRCYMGIIKKISNKNNSLVCIWKITETYDELELLTVERTKIKSRLKQKEFLASRILVKEICQLYNAKYLGIEKDKNDKPFLINSNYHISITHKYPYIGVIIDKKKCGIDIERIDKRIKKIQSKFLDNNELNEVNNSERKMTTFWSIKESAYKINGETIPLKDIKVVKKTDSIYECYFLDQNFKLKTLEIDNHILSFTI